MEKRPMWMKVAIGCGGMVGLFVLAGLVVTLAITFDRPKPGDMQVFTVADTIYQNREGAEGLPGVPQLAGKPVHLKLDLRFAEVIIKKGEQLGSILVEGQYDQANFELKTQSKEEDNYIDYSVSFDSRLNFLATTFSFANGASPEENKITILLPADMPLDIEFLAKIGTTEMDLSGLAVNRFDGKSSMGEFRVISSEPNLIEMEELNYQLNAGDATWSGMENLRVSKADFKGSMGNLNLNATGPLAKDTALNIDFTMGEVKILSPENTNLNDKIRITLGEHQTSKTEKEDSSLPTLTVSGKVKMGEIKIYRVGDPRWKKQQILEKGYNTEHEEAIAMIRELGEDASVIQPNDLNSLGYYHLQRDRPESAIKYFQLNIELHPGYVNGYDSIAEAYFNLDNYEESKKYYEKALEMDPGLNNPANMIRKIDKKLAIRNKETEAVTPDATKATPETSEATN